MCVVALVASFYLVRAQQIDSSIQVAESVPENDTATMIQAIEMVAPTPAESLPQGGTFWSAQHAPGTPNAWPPLPGNMWGLSAWPLGDGQYLLNDTNLDYDALAAAIEAAQPVTASPMMRMSMMSSSLSTAYAYGNPVYLTNMAASFAYDGSITASFGIAGGTNFIPYDILMSTNVATPVANWNWIGIGYTSNNYTFYEQSADLGFYILAKPSKTMTVGFGNDVVGQCDVPFALTNVVQVAGGGGQSLALKTDGTAVGWGQNYYGQATVPTNLTSIAMVAAGWYHSVVMLTNGTVAAWGYNAPSIGYNLTNVPANLTNAIVISAQALHTLALRSDGTMAAWGYNMSGEASVPAGLSNIVAIAAGYQFNLAVTTNGGGTVVAWGYNGEGQCNVPAGLSNVVDVAAGTFHSLALLNNGTVVAWGSDLDGETNVPAGLTNVVAIAASGDPSGLDTAYSMALKKDGTVVVWGYDEAADPVNGMNNVISIAAGADHALAVRTGPPTPVVTLEPTDEYLAQGSTATFTVRGAGLYGVTYQWQTNGVNLSGATNVTLTLTNVQLGMEGPYNAVVTDNGGMGSIASSNASLNIVTPPVITSQTLPTNILCIYGNYVSVSVTATAPGQFNGFPISYQWKLNGTNISGATSNTYSFFATDNSGGNYSVMVSNAAGSTNANWQVAVTNAINVTNDVLLIYNTNSSNSTALKDYYLAHRPMISGANVLGIACDTNEITSSTNYTTQIAAPVLNWLTNNPTKRPQYVVFFYDMPTRLSSYPSGYGSVSYNLHNAYPNWRPFVNYINGGTLADCEAYVDKIAYFGSNYSPGQLIISASAGGYGNTNYVLDGIRHGAGYSGFENYSPYSGVVGGVTNGLIAAGVPTNSILFSDGTEIISNGIAYNLPHPTGVTNVAGYICWGGHSSLGAGYAIDGTVQWKGNSGWWIIRTLESFNGQKADPGQGNFVKWFSSNAFGGTNYSNTPIGASSNVEEPGLESSTTTSAYFGLWASGKNFGVCVWSAINTIYFQAVGDPFVTR